MQDNKQEQEQVHPAAVAQEFMKRCDMKGGEVEAYAQTFNWLNALVEGKLVVLEKEFFEQLVPPADDAEAEIPTLELIDDAAGLEVVDSDTG